MSIFGRKRNDAEPAVDHHDHEQIVEAGNFGSLFEANVALAKLESAGIKASLENMSVGSATYGLTIGSTHRLLVFESDLETAQVLLAEQE